MGIRPRLYLVFGINDLKYDASSGDIIDTRIRKDSIYSPEFEEDRWEAKIPRLPVEENMNEDQRIKNMLFNREFETDGEMQTFSENIFCGTGEANIPILGYIVQAGDYADYLTYGICSIHKELDLGEHYTGYVELPNRGWEETIIGSIFLDLKDRFLKGDLTKSPYPIFRAYMRSNQNSAREVIECRRYKWLYASLDCWTILNWYRTADTLLKMARVYIPKRDMKLMLVCDWG